MLIETAQNLMRMQWNHCATNGHNLNYFEDPLFTRLFSENKTGLLQMTCRFCFLAA